MSLVSKFATCSKLNLAGRKPEFSRQGVAACYTGCVAMIQSADRVSCERLFMHALARVDMQSDWLHGNVTPRRMTSGSLRGLGCYRYVLGCREVVRQYVAELHCTLQFYLQPAPFGRLKFPTGLYASFRKHGNKTICPLIGGPCDVFWTGHILPARTLGENEASPIT